MGLVTCTGYDSSEGYCSVEEGGGSEGEVLLAAPPGIDAAPALGDTLVVLPDGAGGRVVVASFDNIQGGKASAGEFRAVSRTAVGIVLAELYMKADGTVSVTAPGKVSVTAPEVELLAASTKIVGNAEIVGNLVVTGNVTATGAVSGASVGAPTVAAGALSIANTAIPPTLASHVHSVTAAPGTTGGPTAAP